MGVVVEHHRTVRLAPAYEDRDRVWDLVVADAPYPLMMALAGYDMDSGDLAAMPWFRRYWARRGECSTPAAELFQADRFLDAAREVSGTEHVRADRMMVNLMGPMAAGVPHLDTPTFHVAEPLPLWLLLIMGASGLFEEWWIPVCGAVSWFYDGPDGEYEYWPEGPTAPSRAEGAPFGNVAVLGDNDRMFHRVGAVGHEDDRLATGSLTKTAELVPAANTRWQIVDGGRVVADLAPEQLRVSILWGALCFPTAEALRRYQMQEDGLTLRSVTERFAADLRARGVDHVVPDDPATDPVWNRTLQDHYPFPTFAPAASA